MEPTRAPLSTPMVTPISALKNPNSMTSLGQTKGLIEGKTRVGSGATLTIAGIERRLGQSERVGSDRVKEESVKIFPAELPTATLNLPCHRPNFSLGQLTK